LRLKGAAERSSARVCEKKENLTKERKAKEKLTKEKRKESLIKENFAERTKRQRRF